MEQIIKNRIYLSLKFGIYLLGILTLLFFANFSIGSKENWDEIIQNEFFSTFLIRTILLMIPGLIFLISIVQFSKRNIIS